MNLVFVHQYMSSMESQFSRPKEYVPERWLDKEHPLYYGKAHPFAYNPFGFGVRMCAGEFIVCICIFNIFVFNFRMEYVTLTFLTLHSYFLLNLYWGVQENLHYILVSSPHLPSFSSSSNSSC